MSAPARPALPGVFAKCLTDDRARVAQAAGVYPYFAPIEESTPSEARIRGRWKVMLGSNNYLGLTHHPRVLEACAAALRRYGSGSTGSRFLNGTLDLHETLEARLAAFYRKEAALVFTTGYQTSLGAIASLVGRDDVLYLDKLDHACIVDGARLAHGETVRYPHGDLAALARQLERAPEGAGKMIATDGVFSMEGTVADLPGLVALKRAHGAALLVDDAHALGVLGEDGAGTARHFGLDDEVDLVMATFSKSLASVGGVLAGPEEVLHWVRHHARALIFTASMPPASVAGTLAALDVMAEEPERRARLWENTRLMAARLREIGLDPGPAATPILPVTVGDMHATMRVWRALFDDDVFVHLVVPPAVPANSCRIRLSMTAEHTPAQIDRVAEAFVRAVRAHAPWALARAAS
ncbi:pyridoxal phosphate-dependent aminotransferase family protein [Roseisolibacter sp. H3M3-2]|uniref:aminotransferase class I/II-fold pyridoxal phosphate-dependent enzyme n=1 Tax=Roseisolibacter sp. H3M3-2 TaxID=3031323 RepID=UPI0023DBE817|nr:pyridoxal phosphate-dependent aminotransferase family protein [Roseisolibacter sp. H3M3-2]MDF1506038.1 pyridoxal phosphate-dependent aminotransferase family protein [Roseisolibacter sp. H3M3-2]